MQIIIATEILYGDVFGETEVIRLGASLGKVAADHGATNDSCPCAWTQDMGDGVICLFSWHELDEDITEKASIVKLARPASCDGKHAVGQCYARVCVRRDTSVAKPCTAEYVHERTQR